MLLTYFGKKSGIDGGRSLTYVLGNMLSAGGGLPFSCGIFYHLSILQPLMHSSCTEDATAKCIYSSYSFPLIRALTNFAVRLQSWCQQALCICSAQPSTSSTRT